MLLVACGGDDSAGGADPAESSDDTTAATRIVSTAYGDVEVPTDPERIVAVSYEGAWQLRELGVQPVGISDYSCCEADFTSEELEWGSPIEKVGAAWELNLEAVAALQPDLIVGDTDFADEELHGLLAQIAPTALFEGEFRGDWKAVSAMMAGVTGSGDALAASIREYDAKVEQLQADYDDALGPSWTHISFGDGDGQFSVQHPSGITGGLYHEELGAAMSPAIPELSADSADAGYESYPMELIDELLAETDMLVSYWTADTEVHPLFQPVLDNPIFSSVPAVEQGRYYAVTTSVHGYVSALEWMNEVEATILTDITAD